MDDFAQYLKRHPKTADIKTFEEFLAERHIGDEAEIVPLLKECWNQAVKSTAKAHGCVSPCTATDALLRK